MTDEMLTIIAALPESTMRTCDNPDCDFCNPKPEDDDDLPRTIKVNDWLTTTFNR